MAALDVWQSLLLVRASAGSGKTHQLSTRLLGYLLSGEPIDSILAVTFTRKAAGEIRDRVFTRLASACAKEDARKSLVREFESCPFLPDPSILNREKLTARLLELTQNQHRLSILTLDSFFSQLARAFGFELKLPPGWRISEDFEEESLRLDSIRGTIESLSTSELQTWMSMLSKDELRTQLMDELQSTAAEGYALFKQSLPRCWDHPEPISGPESAEVNRAIAILEGNTFRTNQVQKVLKKLAELARSEAWVELIGETIALNFQNGEYRFSRTRIEDDNLIDAVKTLMARGRTAFFIQLRKQTEATREILTCFDAQLHRLRNQRRLISFDDLTHSLSRLLRTEQQNNQTMQDHLQARLDTLPKHLLLDEFQDTAPLQWSVIEPFVEVATANAGSLFCVGDTKQAIYGWRGGRADLFDSLTQRVQGLRDGTLTHSFRSSQFIIDTVNQCFKNLEAYDELERSQQCVADFAREFPQHETKKNLSGFAILETAPMQDGENESDACYARAVEIVKQLREARPHGDIAILTRGNKAIGALISKLRELGIEASQEGGNPLVDSPAVELILAILLFADHPGDSISFHAVATSPIADALGITVQSKQKERAAVAFKVREQLLQSGLGATVAWLVELLRSKVPPRDRSRLEQLVDLADEFESSFRIRGSEFVRFVEERKVLVPTAVPVRVMTIHMSKGLQFDAVVLPDLHQVALLGQQDLLCADTKDAVTPPHAVMRTCDSKLRPYLTPNWRRALEADDYFRTHGALCLAYVAMTRARQGLYMVLPPVSKSPPRHKKFSSLLMGALMTPESDCTRPGQILYKHGSPDWKVEGKSAHHEVAQNGVPKRIEEIPIQLKPAVTRRVIVTSSPVSQPHAATIEQLLDPDRRAADAVGLLVHRWLDHIEWLDQADTVNEEHLHRIASLLPGPVLRYVSVPDWIRRFQEWLSTPPLQNLLRSASYSHWLTEHPGAVIHVRREHSLRGTIDGMAFRGRPDRIVLASVAGRFVRAEVIDFKTEHVDRTNPQELNTFRERYRVPMSRYQILLSQTCRLPPELIQLKLVSLSGREVLEWA